MSLKFEWDREKARLNVENHGVSFEEAATVFGDPSSLTIEDPAHSEYEVRFVIVGESVEQKMVVVVHTDRGDPSGSSAHAGRRAGRGGLMSQEGSHRDDGMLGEYDFREDARGKYARHYAEGSNVVVLPPDVAEAFPDSESVNEALRALMDIARRSKTG